MHVYVQYYVCLFVWFCLYVGAFERLTECDANLEGLVGKVSCAVSFASEMEDWWNQRANLQFTLWRPAWSFLCMIWRNVFNRFESIWKRKEQLCKIPRLFKTTKKKTNVLASWAKGMWLDVWWMEEGKLQQSDFTQLYMVAYVSSIIVWNGCISAVAHITLVKVLLDSYLRYYER